MDTLTPEDFELQEQKEKLMAEILDLQNTLHDLSQTIHIFKEKFEVNNQVNIRLLNKNKPFC